MRFYLNAREAASEASHRLLIKSDSKIQIGLQPSTWRHCYAEGTRVHSCLAGNSLHGAAMQSVILLSIVIFFSFF